MFDDHWRRPDGVTIYRRRGDRQRITFGDPDQTGRCEAQELGKRRQAKPPEMDGVQDGKD